jgi:hypothetical protein
MTAMRKIYSNLSSKVSFWESPDVSVGVKNVFKLIKRNEDARFLFISMNLCNVKNMIQLSDQVLHGVTSLFSRQNPRDHNFQDAIIKILRLGKCLKLVIQETNGLGELDEVPENLIP